MWRHLVHPNIVPLLGITVAPYQLVSAWMTGGELSEYIGMHPDVDRFGLVSFCSTAPGGVLTSFARYLISSTAWVIFILTT